MELINSLHNNSPIISVIIPCYNHGEYILEAIQSVEKDQTRSLYEIIIVNDGSTDEYTNSILKELSKKGYNVIFQENKGLGASRNIAISRSRGKYILPLDADNKIKPEYILESISELEKSPKIAVVYGDAEYFGEREGVWKVGEFDRERLKKANYIDACAVFRKSTWEKCGGYKEDMPYMGWEDWELWLSIVENGFEFKYISKTLFYYRVTQNSMIRNINDDLFKQKVLNSYIFYVHIDLYKEYSDPIKTHSEKLDIVVQLNNEFSRRIDILKNSYSYRIGNIIIKPFSLIKKLFKKS